MTDINSVTMTGNLTKDIEIRNGVAKLSIAVNRSVKDPNTGNWIDVASYFDWVRFLNQNTNIENLQQQLVKGTPVTLMGKARQNCWKDQDGNNQYSINFVVNNWKIHARKQPVAAPPQQNYGKGPESFDDSDIPF